MSSKNIHLSSMAMGIIAIVAGVLVLWQPWLIQWVLGIFLIVWGILSIINK